MSLDKLVFYQEIYLEVPTELAKATTLGLVAW